MLRFITSGLIIIAATSSCRTLSSRNTTLSTADTSCREPILLQQYLEPLSRCASDVFYSSSTEAAKRYLPGWVPCNQITRVDDTVDFFGPEQTDSPDNIRKSTYYEIFSAWLGKKDRFTAATVSSAFTALDAPLLGYAENPINKTQMAAKLRELIRSAENNIVMDIFLLGGSWGVEIMHELAMAANRGVEVVILHDIVSKFSVANEIDPLWDETLRYSQTSRNFTALAAHPKPPQRVSSMPFGFEKVGAIVAKVVTVAFSPEGYSDHSKIVFIDALPRENANELRDASPKAFVSSRNLVDSAASFYHDEAIIISGPAAVIALLSYESDLSFAFEHAKYTSNQLNADDRALLESLLKRMQGLRRGPTYVKAAGSTAVQAIEVSANDEVRNLDSGILSRLMDARVSIDIYEKIAYNWSIAIALKAAMARGVRVRVVMDQQTPFAALLNATLPYMVGLAPRRLPDGKETTEILDYTGKVLAGESQLPFRWFLPFRPGFAFQSGERSDLAQELHAKTIIVDNRYTLLGSANLDSITWAGGFREYSVWVDDLALAEQATMTFERLWNHPILTISHETWLGDSEPSAALKAYYQEEAKARPCKSQERHCDLQEILQGGKQYSDWSPARETIRTIVATEAMRIKLLMPNDILQNERGEATCLPLKP